MTPTPNPTAERWAVRDTLTGAIYQQPNKMIAERVAEMHGNSVVVPLSEGAPSKEQVKAAHRAYYDANPEGGYLQAMRAALTAAGVAPQEPSESDERITAWEAVADHEAFEPCYAEARPLLDSILDRLTLLAEIEQTVNELAPAPELQAIDPKKVAEVERAASARALEEAASAWAADPDAWGDNEKDYRNELRARAVEIREGKSDD